MRVCEVPSVKPASDADAEVKVPVASLFNDADVKSEDDDVLQPICLAHNCVNPLLLSDSRTPSCK